MHRPFRRADIVASMERADSTPGPDSTLIRKLIAQYKDLEAPIPVRRRGARRLPGDDQRSPRPDAPGRKWRHLAVRRRPAGRRVRSRGGGEPPGHRTAHHRRPRLARPDRPHGRRPDGRGLSRPPVQDLGAILVRPVRPELGPGQLLRHPAQQLRLSPQLSRARCRLARCAPRGTGGEAAGRDRLAGPDADALPLHAPPRCPVLAAAGTRPCGKRRCGRA